MPGMNLLLALPAAVVLMAGCSHKPTGEGDHKPEYCLRLGQAEVALSEARSELSGSTITSVEFGQRVAGRVAEKLESARVLSAEDVNVQATLAQAVQQAKRLRVDILRDDLAAFKSDLQGLVNSMNSVDPNC
jgi:hypothetical protein